MDNTEIKETITRGQAMDVADAKKFNEDVKASDIGGSKESRDRWGNEKIMHDPRREVDFDDGLDFIEVNINGIYSYRDDSQFKQRVYVTDDRHGSGISVNGYASKTPENRNRTREDGNFSIYFDNKEQVIAFANKCLDMLLIAEESAAIKERYKDNWLDGKHPEVLAHFPNLMQKLQCETGRYYWDASLNKVVEITKDTSQDILDVHPHYELDEDGKFEPSYTNENAEEQLAGILAGIESNWDEEHYQGINLAELQTGIGYNYRESGYIQRKGKDPKDKRRKQWTTMFYFADGQTETLIGCWEITRGGTLNRNQWREE
ncbi:hypothetical protein [uncultured Mediterranean phage uvMED]|nr:hypothetical protein [uncultured Mediterranean phage uvMED]|tara:strand:+ start:486 stop:1439 length:954 start_codon:yes stop_codon:yes gene_type:complete